jgi:uncharacterized protein HemX
MTEPWDQSTGIYPAVQPSKKQDTTAIHTAKRQLAGIGLRIGASKFVVPTAAILAALTWAILQAWNLGAAYLAGIDQKFHLNQERLAALERQVRDQEAATALRLQTLEAMNQRSEALQLRIEARLAELNARVAEVQVTLMRRGTP